MSRLRSYSRSLREIFEGAVTAQYIASALVSFDAERTAMKIGAGLLKRGFDQVGVRINGVVSGYALRTDLVYGRLGHHMRPFVERDLVPGDLPLLETLESVREGVIYLRLMGEVGGIVTEADVGKPPVRLWLFGLITVAEMQLTRVIRNRYPDDSWTCVCHESKVASARKLLADKKKKNTQVDLLDCLMLSDKQKILDATPDLVSALGLGGSGEFALTSKRILALRNALAHADDISGYWPHFLEYANELERLVDRAEALSGRDLRTCAS